MARRALLLEGTDDIELTEGVTLRRGEDRISSLRMMVHRREDGSLRAVAAEGEVSGTGVPPGQPRHTFKAERAEMHWDEQGRKSRVLLSGQAVVHRGGQGMAASRIVAVRRDGPEGGWDVTATGGVFSRGSVRSLPAELLAERLVVSLDDDHAILEGEARGNVRFRNGDTSTEAARAEIRPGPEGLEVALIAGGERRAKLASDRRRVVADRIVTRTGSGYMKATGQVEAALLPTAEDAGGDAVSGLFRQEEAVHFVSLRMESGEDGEELVFTGSVRGWQGERNLSADRVELRGKEDRLAAKGRVTTRIPRLAANAVSQSEYIQVSSGELDYHGSERRAVFTGQVRVRQAEGWMESERLEVDLNEGGGGIRMLRAYRDVRIEYRAPSGEGVPEPINGTADRVEYTPSDSLVRLFGDETFATVSRSGEKAEGRVLRYQLDTGRIDVESGETDRAKIRTSGS
jgi:lipopolysaccharide transport protein LptA